LLSKWLEKVSKKPDDASPEAEPTWSLAEPWSLMELDSTLPSELDWPPDAFAEPELGRETAPGDELEWGCSWPLDTPLDGDRPPPIPYAFASPARVGFWRDFDESADPVPCGEVPAPGDTDAGSTESEALDRERPPPFPDCGLLGSIESSDAGASSTLGLSAPSALASMPPRGDPPRREL
jgi:hypothetical protein